MGPRKITFIETCNKSPHLETTLEIAKNHLEKGDTVNYHFIGKKVPFNEILRKKKRLSFYRFSPEELGARLISHPNLTFDYGRVFRLVRNLILPEFQTLDELKNFKYENYSAGMACASSLISHLRLSRPCVDEHKRLIKTILISGISTYEYTRSLLRRQEPDLVYLFNGRFSNNRAILEAAIELNVPYMIHERGANKTKYSIYPHMPHNMGMVAKRISSAWQEAPDDEAKNQLGREFYIKNRSGIEQGWTSFTSEQVKGKTLDVALNGRRLISYFSSSDDEYAAVGDIVDWGSWRDQLNAVESLINIVGDRRDLFLVIRMHPHKRHKHKDDLVPWWNLRLPENVCILKPDDSVDSYALIERSDAVITCGSTIGIEAVFWGVPSICIGPCFYGNLDAVYLPRNPSELQRLLEQDALIADPAKTLPYGYYLTTFGEKFVHYEPESLFSGRFLGVNLQGKHVRWRGLPNPNQSHAGRNESDDAVL